MQLKHATLIAIIGQAISLLWYAALNLNLLHWHPVLGLILNIISIGSLLVFFITLYVKQTK